jgi:drug/metabolite transporter (DMT)-like permease
MRHASECHMQRAILIMFMAMSLIPAGDSAGKILTSQMGVAPVFVAWSRFAIGLIILIPFIPDQTRALFGNWRIWVRAAMICGGIFQLLSAVALGWVLFGALPDAMTWIGLAVILSAGIASTRLR